MLCYVPYGAGVIHHNEGHTVGHLKRCSFV